MLAAWGFTTAEPRSLHLMAGSKEDAETAAFFQDMRARGLGDPLLLVSDGRTRDHQGDRDLLPALGASTLPRAPDAQLGCQVTRDPVARVQDPRSGRLPGAIARDLASGLVKATRPHCEAPSLASKTTSKPVSRI